MKTFENNKTPNLITLKIGKYINIRYIKSDKLTYEPDIKKYGEEYAYYSKVKDISIFLNDEYIAKIKIDERKYNTIDEDYTTPKFNHKYVKDSYDIITEFLFRCHSFMKDTNKDYGKYGTKGKMSYEFEGKIPLLVHHFFDFVEDDYKNNKSAESIRLKEFQKNLELYLEMEKYNL